MSLYQPCPGCKSYNLCECYVPCKICKSYQLCNCGKNIKKKNKILDANQSPLDAESLPIDKKINMEVNPYETKIINLYDRLTEDCNPMTFRNPYPHLVQHPLRCVVVGGSSAGKTNLILNMIMMMCCFDVVYLYSPRIDEPIYVGIRKYFGDKMHAFKSVTDIMEGPDYAKLHPGKQICIIFDDLMNHLQELILDLFSAGRKCNLSTFFITQSYFKVDKAIRLNTNCFVIKDIATKRDKNMVISELAQFIEPEDLKDMYDDCQSAGYDACLLIDKQTKDKNKMYRKGMNLPYIIADKSGKIIPRGYELDDSGQIVKS